MTDYTKQILHLARLDQRLTIMADESKLLGAFLAKKQADQRRPVDDATVPTLAPPRQDREVALTSIASSLRRKGLDDAKLGSTLNILNRGFSDPLPTEQVAILVREVSQHISRSDHDRDEQDAVDLLEDRLKAAMHEGA